MRDVTDKRLLGLELVQMVTALALFITPWVFGFENNEAAAWSAWITAGFMFALASLTSADEPEWAGWTTLIIGLWTLISPAVLGFTVDVKAFWSHIGTGAVTALAAVALLWLTRRQTAQTA